MALAEEREIMKFPFDDDAIPADLRGAALRLADMTCLAKRSKALIESARWPDGSVEKAHHLEMAWLYEAQTHRRKVALRILEGKEVKFDRMLLLEDADLMGNALIADRATILDALRDAEQRITDGRSLHLVRAAQNVFRPG